MKRLLLFFLLAILLPAQSTPEVEITAEPHHHLTFENRSVRVFNVEVPPGEATQLHWHRHDYIAVTLGPAEISNAVKDKPTVALKFAGGDTLFSSATFAHLVRTTSPQPFRNVTVELLQDAALRTATAKWDASKNEDRSLDILPAGTIHILFVKDNVRVSEVELQPGAVITESHHTGPHLLIAVTDLSLSSNIAGPRLVPGHFKSGDSKWLPGGYSDHITNTGAKPAKYVTLEFP